MLEEYFLQNLALEKILSNLCIRNQFTTDTGGHKKGRRD